MLLPNVKDRKFSKIIAHSISKYVCFSEDLLQTPATASGVSKGPIAVCLAFLFNALMYAVSIQPKLMRDAHYLEVCRATGEGHSTHKTFAI